LALQGKGLVHHHLLLLLLVKWFGGWRAVYEFV